MVVTHSHARTHTYTHTYTHIQVERRKGLHYKHQRLPAYCDRVLFRSNLPLKQVCTMTSKEDGVYLCACARMYSYAGVRLTGLPGGIGELALCLCKHMQLCRDSPRKKEMPLKRRYV
eukprot:scaffold234985_cov21-Tisochrysis_lutea.AAC.2